MTLYLSPNYYPFSVPLIMEFTHCRCGFESDNTGHHCRFAFDTDNLGHHCRFGFNMINQTFCYLFLLENECISEHSGWVSTENTPIVVDGAIDNSGDFFRSG
jgi:hypothetical protein